VTDAWLVALAVTRSWTVETGTTMMSVWGVPSRAIRSVEWEVETKHQRTETAQSFAARIHLAQPLGPIGETLKLPLDNEQGLEDEEQWKAAVETARAFAQAAVDLRYLDLRYGEGRMQM
jgi:hypothetical protein